MSANLSALFLDQDDSVNSERNSVMNTPRVVLSGVPEEFSSTVGSSGATTPRSPYIDSTRKSSSGRSSGDRSNGSGSSRRPSSNSANRTSSGSKSIVAVPPKPRYRANPHLPHAQDAPPAPATTMYWSRAPVYGELPTRSMRAHSITLVDTLIWLFGGCDDKECFRDVYCFDIETMMWSHPEMQGEIPPPCRAHTATLVDRKIVIFGGGQGSVYYNSTYILDTATRRWTRPTLTGDLPAPRRAHTAVLYRNKIWIFGGGNGMEALNDLWTLEIGSSADRMRWEKVKTYGQQPRSRGYHTANLHGNIMIVVGGSDGKECFSDIWCLDLDALVWRKITPQTTHRRLAHTATQVGSYLFLVGGHDGDDYNSELLLFNLAVTLQYEPLARAVLGKPPSPRGYHSAIVADSRLFLFGGFNGHDVFDDVYILDLASAAYLPQVTSFKIDFDAVTSD